MADRFWRKVGVGSSEECWLWTAGLSKTGYGNIMTDNQRSESSHRAAWLLSNGEIPEGLVVRHKCGVRACCNPAHLELGTQRDNVLDRSKHGTSHGWKFEPKKSCNRGHSDWILGNDGRRRCRICRNMRARFKYDRTKYDKPFGTKEN